MADDKEEIRRRIDLLDLVSERIPNLKPSGRNRYFGSCIYHSDSSPSFCVNIQTQNYHCFSCKVSGDIFSWVMQTENVEFRDAMEILADRIGYQLTHSGNPELKKEQERAREVLECGLRYFRNHFAGADGKEARAYMKKRGFNDATLDSFEVGWAPNNYEGLMNHGKTQGIEPREFTQVGLAFDGRRGPADFFRGRVIFPVRDDRGRLVAFGGRILDGDGPKYLNSPESPVFHKSRTLFNLHQAREMFRQHECFLMMEGYTDVMMAHQQGMGPAIATLGTSMTSDHVSALRRYSVPIYMIYDGDLPGQKAAARSLVHFLELGVSAKSIVLPEGIDPCDFLLREGWQAQWEEMKREAPDLFIRVAENLANWAKGKDANSVSKAVHQMLEVLNVCDDRVLRSLYLDELSRIFGIEKHALNDQLRSLLPAEPRKSSLQRRPVKREEETARKFLQDDYFYLLVVLINKPDLLGEFIEKGQSLPEPPLPTRILLDKWIEAHDGKNAASWSEIESQLNETEREILAVANLESIPEDALGTEMQHRIDRLTNDAHFRMLLHRHIKRAQKEGALEYVAELMKFIEPPSS